MLAALCACFALRRRCRGWPGAGAIEFQDVWCRYRPGLSPVLSRLSFVVEVRASPPILPPQVAFTSLTVCIALARWLLNTATGEAHDEATIPQYHNTCTVA